MRTIKFRGKRVDNGEWVYGDLIHGVNFKKGQMYILPNAINLAYLPGCDPLDGYHVQAESVGQYMGFGDKTGRDAYEGDAYAYDFEYDSDYDGDMAIVKHAKGRRTFKDIFDTTHYKWCSAEGGAIEVIGNIHDNPELLTQ